MADGRVVATTENNTVYVMAARSRRILWSRHLAKPVPSRDLPCGRYLARRWHYRHPSDRLQAPRDLPRRGHPDTRPVCIWGCGSVAPSLGLNLFTGKVELDERALPNAGEDQLAQLQRPGLALDHGFVVIAYGQNSGDFPAPTALPHGFVVSIRSREAGSSTSRSATGGRCGWAAASPVVDPHGNVYVASADGYDLGAGQRYDHSDAVLELSPTMHLKSIFYPKDWQKLSADDLDLGTGDPTLVHGFVLQVGKTDTAYLLRQGHLGGAEGEVASLSVCSGDPDGGHAVKGSVVYIPCRTA